jgi:hypothetical protein
MAAWASERVLIPQILIFVIGNSPEINADKRRWMNGDFFEYFIQGV